MELDIVSIKDGHKTRKVDPKNEEDFDDVCEVVMDKLNQGWILYGGKKGGDLKIILNNRNPSKEDVAKAFKKNENVMLDTKDEDEEAVFYERAVLAAPLQGG